MKLNSRLPDYLRHIQEAAQQTLAYVDGMDFAGFQADTRTQKAVLFNFVILGEASAKVMDKHSDFVGQHPEVPWRAIRNIRNQVAHGYFNIDYEVLWAPIASALPALLRQLPTDCDRRSRPAAGCPACHRLTFPLAEIAPPGPAPAA